MKVLKGSKFGWKGSNAPSFTEVADGIGIDAQGVAYEKEGTKEKPADIKDKLPNKDDAVYTGDDSTGFGYVGAFEQFMSACRQSGGSDEHCIEAWLLKKSGVGLTEEKVKLIKEYLKGKRVDTLQYNDGDYEKLKNDFGLDLIEKLEKVDGICANNLKLVAENKKIKDDLIAMKSIYDGLQTSWIKKAEAEKLELKDDLSKNYGISDDFLKDKELDELKNYMKIVEIIKEGAKDDGVKLTPEEEAKRDFNDKFDGIDPRFIGNNPNGIINDFPGYIDRKMVGVKKEKFGWGGED